MKLISIPLIFLLSLVSTFAQIRPNRFTTNGDPGAWVFLPMPALTAYANGTNYGFDWQTNSYRLQGTGDIAFQYSTNWGLMGTNRFARVYIPPTNTYRHVFFANLATNWHNQTRPIVGVPTGYGATINFQSFGSGETNVTYVPEIDTLATTTNWQGQFNPASIGGLVLWWEASQGISRDEYGVSPSGNGLEVRSITDLSGTFGRATNANAACNLFYRDPNNSPGNIPSLNFTPGNPAWLVTPTFTALTQPNWVFVMFQGRGGNGLPFVDGQIEGNRMACFCSETPALNISLYSGTSLNLASGSSIGWRLFSFEQNGASSIIRTNGIQGVTGNSGAQTPTRWTLGSDYGLSSFPGNAYMAEMLVYHSALTAQNITNIESYLWNKYGTPHP